MLNQNISMISEGSCNTEDLMLKIQHCITEIKYIWNIFKYETITLNYNNIL